MTLSNVLVLLQVRNAIQRMKDKKKALSFTVSCQEALLPTSFAMHPPEEGPRCMFGLLWGDDVGKKSHVFLLFVSLSFSPVGQCRPKDNLPGLGSILLYQGGVGLKVPGIAVQMK